MAKAFAASDLAVGTIVKFNGSGLFVAGAGPTDLVLGVLRESVDAGYEGSTCDEQNPEGQVLAGQSFAAGDIGKALVCNSVGRAILLEGQDPGLYRVFGYLEGAGASGSLVRFMFNRCEGYVPPTQS
jgi:hypothetical protein